MANTSSIDLSEWNDFHKQLQQFLVEDQQQIVEHATTQAVVEFDQIVRDELPPMPRKKKVSQYWTAKQRAWWWGVMAAKANGKSRALPGWKAQYVVKNGRRVLQISGAYKRTGTGMKSLTYRVTSGHGANGAFARAEYGTNKAHMRYVIDADMQSKYHAGNWNTLQALLAASADTLVRTFTEDMNRELDRRLK